MTGDVDPRGVMLRWASSDEASTLHDLYRRSASTSESGGRAIAERPGMMEPTLEDLEAGRVRVATHEGRIAGFAVSVTGDDGSAELDALFVDPGTWRRGVGRRLVDDAARRARAEGANRLMVTANPDAVAFYEALAFLGDGTVETDFGPAERMYRRLV